MTVWQIILIFYGIIVLSTLSAVLFFAGLDNRFVLLDTPKELHEKTSMNWFGCVFIWFLEFLLNPIWWIVAIILEFFHWLFTVGRK